MQNHNTQYLVYSKTYIKYICLTKEIIITLFHLFASNFLTPPVHLYFDDFESTGWV